MVRVISVHHFANQHIQTVEQPTACTVAPPNRLLLALMNNCVEVRDLNKESEVLFTFPTVDEVIQIVHCLNGDYVASLETKFNRQNRETNFVRVYINWDSIATLQQSKMTSSGATLDLSECGMVQPMRARIAGRVTPTTNQSEISSLEMIEIPVKRNPNAIACCQISGNLAILSHRVVNLYRFQIRSHDISKQKFVDFDELPVLVELTFTPSEMLLSENYVALMNRDTLHMFKIIIEPTVFENTGNQNGDTDYTFFATKDEPIDFQQLKNEEELNIIANNNKKNFTINLPTVTKENSLIHKYSPFTFTDRDLKATFRPSSPIEGRIQGYKMENLIQLRLIPIQIENAQRHVTEEFKSMVLKPLYIDSNLNSKSHNEWESNPLKSDYKKCLNGISFVVATQQEGYLFYFADKDTVQDKDNCIAVYPFTAPVYKLVMEDYFLHALTETGLESYTLRVGHQLCRNFEVVDSVNVACPPIDDCICLVGLRPFLGVEKIFLSENHMVLLASSDETSPAHSVSSSNTSGSSTVSFLTLYNLELPTPKTIFNDISIVANVHRFSSSQTYCHLLSEAHMILRMGLVLKKWTMTDDTVKLVWLVRDRNQEIVETYRTSCALLGDHYIMCTTKENYVLSIPYYKMAGITPFEVLSRVKKIQEQNNLTISEGLVHYLKHTLLEIKTSIEADKYFRSASKHNFAEIMLDLLKNHGYADLPSLILKSKILREYSTDKLISIICENYQNNESNSSEKYLALCVLHLQKSNTTEAEFCLRKISQEKLTEMLLDNWDLFFETSYLPQQQIKKGSNITMTFSDLSVLLISVCPNLLSDMLVKLIVDKKAVNLCKIIKIFLEYLPSSIGNDSNFASLVLQKTLESYFTQYFLKPENSELNKIVFERGSSEAMKLLVRSYLSQLQVLQIRDETSFNKIEQDKSAKNKDLEQENELDETEKDREQEKLRYNMVYKTYFDESDKRPKETFMFSDLRYKYLDKMPPFQINILPKLYEACRENYPVMPDCRENPEADKVLRKLQALLCSQVVPKQVLTEVQNFLTVNENLRGNTALRSIILHNSDAILFLIDNCPQCLLQFAKDRFLKPEDWSILVAAVQNKLLNLSQTSQLARISFFYKKLLRDILTHIASTYPLETLLQILAQDLDAVNLRNDSCEVLKELKNYEPYFQICKDTTQANNINKMLTAKAQQLLCTLNL